MGTAFLPRERANWEDSSLKRGREVGNVPGQDYKVTWSLEHVRTGQAYRGLPRRAVGGTPLHSGLDPAPKIRPLSGLPGWAVAHRQCENQAPGASHLPGESGLFSQPGHRVFSDFLLLGALAGLGLPRRCPVHISGRAVPLLPVCSPVALPPHPGDGSFLASVLRPGVPSAPLAHVVWCHLCLGGLTLLSAESIHGVSGSWTPSPRPEQVGLDGHGVR